MADLLVAAAPAADDAAHPPPCTTIESYKYEGEERKRRRWSRSGKLGGSERRPRRQRSPVSRNIFWKPILKGWASKKKREEEKEKDKKYTYSLKVVTRCYYYYYYYYHYYYCYYYFTSLHLILYYLSIPPPSFYPFYMFPPFHPIQCTVNSSFIY